ncbi:MAG: hypothetical protein Q9219_001676 [cf. Caloplaca sp. 3 TL-2023]
MNHQAADYFRYERLSEPHSIRLLRLSPASSLSEPVHCSLVQTSLNNVTPYEALSYTWGDATERSQLSIDGKKLSITSNLDTALRYLRAQNGPRTLWVDAVCIDQNDLDERNQQVALMRDVYSKASQVVAWLGEEHPLDAGALNFDEPEPFPEQATEVEKIKRVMGLQVRLSSSLISTKALIQRPWFSRAWIIQEAALARRLQIQCGKTTVDWEKLYPNMRLLEGMVDGSGAQIVFNNSYFDRLQFIESTRTRIKSATRSDEHTRLTADGAAAPGQESLWKQFHSAVVNARSYGASNPRDHIYALLGLVEQSDPGFIPVDYSLPHATIFRDFVRQIIRQTRDLSALGQIDSWPTAGFTSWTPDYSRQSMVDPLSNDGNPFYTASGDSSIRLTEMGAASAFTCWGIFFDIIDEVTAGPSTEKDKVFSRSEILGSRTADNLHPAVLLPKIAYKAIRHFSPQGKEYLDNSPESLGYPGGKEHSKFDGTDLTELDRLYKNRLDYFADFCLTGQKNKTEAEAKNAWEMLITMFGDLGSRRRSHLFGPTSASNNVYMKPALEDKWQRLAKKCRPYPSGEGVEDAYWRTLIGNKRTGLTNGVDKPPELWRDAYAIWEETLWRKEGTVPRFLRGGGLRLKEGTSDQDEKPISEALHAFLRNSNAEQQKMTLDDHLKASGMRAAISAAIRISQPSKTNDGDERESYVLKGMAPLAKLTTSINPSIRDNIVTRNLPELHVTPKDKPAGFTPLSEETIDQLADWVDRYPDIQPHEKEQLMALVAPIADNKASKDESVATQRAKIDQVFRYDHLRVARNRKFCITKKRYMGWCPFNAKAGDRVCILFGGQTPYVVRQEGGGWKLLGEAYLHGVMDGEVLGWRGGRMEEIRIV